MIDRNKQQFSPDTTEPFASEAGGGVTSPARRRFVKRTTLALPAIMTLRSGASAAASITCRVRTADTGQGGLPEDQALITTDSTNWVRQQVDMYDKKTSDNPLTYDGQPHYYQDTIVNPLVWREYPNGTLVNGDGTEPSDKGNVIGTYHVLVFYRAEYDMQGNPVNACPVALAATQQQHDSALSDTCFASTGILPPC